MPLDIVGMFCLGILFSLRLSLYPDSLDKQHRSASLNLNDLFQVALPNSVHVVCGSGGAHTVMTCDLYGPFYCGSYKTLLCGAKSSSQWAVNVRPRLNSRGFYDSAFTRKHFIH